MTDDPVPSPPPLAHRSARPPFWQRIPIIWIVPVLALAVTLAIAYRAYSDRGVLIRITFEDATGITPGQTQLRFREVHVGTVEATGFTDDLTRVVASVRVNRDVAPYIDAEAQFWLVRPEVTAQGISRLDTVLSGVFIEGYWDAAPGAPRTDFTGEPRQPADIRRVPGTFVTLRVDDAAGLSDGIPVLYRGMEVGQLRNLRLLPGGEGVAIDAYVDAPHDGLLTSQSVFWHMSGFSISLGATGVSFNVRSLSALVRGGVEFTTPVSGGGPVSDGSTFRLHPNESSARDSLFELAEGTEVHVAVLLDGEMRGLAQGAPVQYRGLPVGEVASLGVVIQDRPDGSQVALQRAVLRLWGGRMGLPDSAGEDEVLDYLEAQVEEGMRARAASAGIFGTSVVMELVQIPEAPPASLDREADPWPVMPGAPSSFAASASAEGLFARLSSLPIEDVMTAATGFLNNATALVSSPEIRETPGAVRGLIDDARRLIGSDEVRRVPESLAGAIDDLRSLTAGLREAGVDEKLALALDRATEVAGSIGTATDELPALIASLRGVAEEAATIGFRELGARASAIMAQVEELAGTSDARALPARVNETLAELSSLLATLRDGGAVEALNATMEAARSAAEGVAQASADLPALTARIDRAVASLDTMIATYGERSTFNAETLAALRELRRTAASFGSLARTLERNPNALITGR